MGVKGLWELLHPVARPIKMDTLSNKRLAIDASIWLHQFLRGMRDKDGQAIGNAHILGFYRRICKLLYFNIKPIFIFDGGTPGLKRLTIVERRKQRRNNENMVKKTAEKLLAAQLRLRALEQRKLARTKKREGKVAKDAQPGAVHDSTDSPQYLEELLDPSKPVETKQKLSDLASDEFSGTGGGGSNGGSRARKIQDKFVLPPMDTDFETLSKIRSHDERFGYQAGEDDVSAFLEDFKKEEGLNNIDSDVFKALPPEMQYEILQEIRQRSRVTSFERVQEMVRLAETPMDFSKLQVQGVIRRNNVTHKLLTVNQSVNKIEETVKPGRIASQRNRQYLLVKNEEGGWVLGGRKPTTGATADKPVQLDSDDEDDPLKKEIKAEVERIKKEMKGEDEEGWESDDDDDPEMIEVKGDLSPYAIPPTATLRPLAPKITSILEDENSLVNHPEAYVDEDEPIEKVMAKFAEIEDETARKRGIVSDFEGTEALPMDVDELDSFDTLNSLDTVYSDVTLDEIDDFEDLMEDEETGEIVSRKAYERKQVLLARNRPASPVDDYIDQRALSMEEESQLEQEGFHNYWVGYTPASFKDKHSDYEFMLQAALVDWDDEQLSDELHSAKRKLEKSNVNDTAGVEALKFWTSFLTSVAARRLYAQPLIDNAPSPSSTPPTESASAPVPGQQPSRISHLDLLDDGEEDIVESAGGQASGDDDDELAWNRSSVRSAPIHQDSQADTLSATEDLRQSEGATPLQLDFGSSILKQRLVSIVSAAKGDTLKTPEEAVSASLLESITIPSVDTVAEMDIDAEHIEVDSRVEPVVARPKLDSVTPPVDGDDTEKHLDNELEEGEQPDMMVEDEEDDEDDAHNADLENEEQDFTNLFPDMASLPGALLIPKEPTLTLTTEEQKAMDEQEATKMFEESRQLESEIKGLKSQHHKHQRNAEDLTESMIAETQMLLKLFGIPYIVAPMEAEAQCADLQLRGVVEGILTEDSDVFLFGGVRIFKNVFREEKYVECYLMSDIERDLGVGRDRLISLAYLLGSDYTTGVKGVGLVTAMEILRLFPKLEDFAKWWRGEQLKEGKLDGGDQDDESKGSLDDLGLEMANEEALEKLAKQCKKIHLPSTFPDPHIADAYVRPMVDDDDAKFQWGIPDLDGLRDYLRKSMSWDRGEVDKVLLPIIRQMAAQASQQSTQSTLDSFFDSSAGMGGYQMPPRKHLIKSARLRKVVNGLTGQARTEIDAGASDKGTKKKRATTKKATSKQEQAAVEESESKSTGDGDSTNLGSDIDVDDNNDNEGDDGDDVVMVEEPKKHKRTRGQRATQTKVPEAVTAAKRQLQSKNIEVKLAARQKNRDAASAAATLATVDTTMSTPEEMTSHKGQKRVNSSGSSSGRSDSSSGDDDDGEDFAPSHWDLLEERQRQHQQQQHISPVRKKTTVTARAASGKASSLTAIVSASNAARYGSVGSKDKKSGRKKPRT